MASLELGKLSTYDLLLSENCKDIYYVRLTDSLYKTLEDYHINKNRGQIQLTVSKAGRGGIIEVVNERSTSRYNFKCNAISNKTGLDCLKQTQANPGLTLVGTASTRLIIQATEDVYQSTREKLILAEEKKNENQTVMIDFKNKRKSVQSAKMTKHANNESASSSYAKSVPQMSNLSKPPQRTVPTFKASSSIVNDSKAQRHLRERAIHILALRPHRKIELLSKLQEAGPKSKDAVTKILAQISNTQNNMFHLKSFLYGEVQVDTWPDYSASDRTAIRQQLKLHGIETKSPEQEAPVPHRESPAVVEEPTPPPRQELSKKVEQYISSAPKFVKQSQPPPQQEQTNSTTNKQTNSSTRDLNNKSRKRSSSDDTKTSKKQCREALKESGDVNGINVNVVSRRAADELRLPFIESVKVELAKLQLDYVTIVSTDQKVAYAAEFHRDYEEYLKLKKREKEVGQQFAVLKANYDKVERKSSEFRSITRKTRDLFKQYMNDTNWCKDKERLMKLEAKLSHIKQLFRQYEQRGS